MPCSPNGSRSDPYKPLEREMMARQFWRLAAAHGLGAGYKPHGENGRGTDSRLMDEPV